MKIHAFTDVLSCFWVENRGNAALHASMWIFQALGLLAKGRRRRRPLALALAACALAGSRHCSAFVAPAPCLRGMDVGQSRGHMQPRVPRAAFGGRPGGRGGGPMAEPEWLGAAWGLYFEAALRFALLRAHHLELYPWPLAGAALFGCRILHVKRSS